MFFCFFKQKTAYEMRISDWSSDVCSSDLSFAHQLAGNEILHHRLLEQLGRQQALREQEVMEALRIELVAECQFGGSTDSHQGLITDEIRKIGRASCRERVCQYV